MKERIQHENLTNESLLGDFMKRNRRDITYYIVAGFFFLVALYALLAVKTYQNQCNNHWLEEINNSGCMQTLKICLGHHNQNLPYYDKPFEYPILNGKVEYGNQIILNITRN